MYLCEVLPLPLT